MAIKTQYITLSIVIPTLNSSDTLLACISKLNSAKLPVEIIIVDGGSDDSTLQISSDLGLIPLKSEKGRGQQLANGAELANSDWLLFLHSDTILSSEWYSEVQDFISKSSNIRQAAAFKFCLNDNSFSARLIEIAVHLRCKIFGLPYGDQALLISRIFYRELGGYSHIPIMEDVALIRQIGKENIFILNTPAITSAKRYKKDGWLKRPIRNLFCLLLYYLRWDINKIKQFYK